MTGGCCNGIKVMATYIKGQDGTMRLYRAGWGVLVSYTSTAPGTNNYS